jgi:hypothetical protein
MVSPPATAPTGTTASWHFHPVSQDYADATIPCCFEEKRHLSIFSLTSMRYPLRSFVRLLLYSGAHSHLSRPLPCSTQYALQSVLHSPTMLWPYRCGNRISLFTRWRNLSLLNEVGESIVSEKKSKPNASPVKVTRWDFA